MADSSQLYTPAHHSGTQDQRLNSTNYVHPQETNLLNVAKAMAYDPFGAPVLRIDDTSLQHTAKDRAKVSDFELIFFNTFQFSKETDVWDEYTANGGSATHNTNTSQVEMTVTNQVGSTCVRQTRNVQRYVPGRQNELSFAVRLETPVAGIRRRIGIFDENNGLFFEDGGDGDYYCVVRSNTSGSVVERRIGRADWNGDRLDGTGPSGIVADPTKQQMVIFEYEWYGAGLAEIKFLINDHPHTIHKFYHANVLDTVWCGTPFLPIRLEITNVTGASGTHKLFQGSNSLTAEGSVSKLGIAQNVLSPITGKTMAVAYTFYPVLSIRLKPGALKGIVLPTYFQVATTDNTSIFYKLVRNATLTGASFVDMPDSNSFTQYDISATACTGGVDLDAGFVIAGGGGTGIRLDQNTVYQIGRGSMGTVSDILTICVACPNTNKSALSAMTWIEQR